MSHKDFARLQDHPCRLQLTGRGEEGNPMTLTCKISVVGRLVTETIYASYIDLWLKSLLAEGIRSCCCHGSESITKHNHLVDSDSVQSRSVRTPPNSIYLYICMYVNSEPICAEKRSPCPYHSLVKACTGRVLCSHI